MARTRIPGTDIVGINLAGICNTGICNTGICNSGVRRADGRRCGNRVKTAFVQRMAFAEAEYSQSDAAPETKTLDGLISILGTSRIKPARGRCPRRDVMLINPDKF